MNWITVLINKVDSYSKQERIKRLIELSVEEMKVGYLFPHQYMEIELIQTIRKLNGEIDEVLKNRVE